MNPNHNSFTRTLTALALLAGLSLAACTATGPHAEDVATTEAGAAAEQPVEPWDGDGMDIPLDGSSMDAWNRSMARVRAHVDEGTYRSLENAIDYLLVYDLGARNDMQRLAARLDGMTGYEILSRVRWRGTKPGTGPAEKGSKDASLIDKSGG